jgi:hypothetical protein
VLLSQIEEEKRAILINVQVSTAADGTLEWSAKKMAEHESSPLQLLQLQGLRYC